MGLLIFSTIFIICIIAGFNGMPLLLIFPFLSLLLIITIVIFDKGDNNIDYNEKKTNGNNVTDEEIEEFIIFDKINKK